MIDRQTIDRILAAAPIEQVIGEFVSLKRRGANYMACCPFHHEKTPSFSVSPSKGIYKCFGCGKAGNVVSFIMEHEQLSYVEALKYLGRKYGIPVEEKEEDAAAVAQRQRHESMVVVNTYARKFFSDYLWNDAMGAAVGLSYFRERGFNDVTICKFQLGYAPAVRDAFTKKALSDGYKIEFLTATGLSIAVEREHQPTVYRDRFTDRVIFPIHSLSGRIIAFGGRSLKHDRNIAKYINSPESELYHKSRSLYGIYFAKQSITRLQKCYLVEGYTDVLSLWQAGIQNVVASSGTSLTTEQIRMIHRFSPRVTVLYDGDDAGIRASIRGIDMLLEEGLQVKVVRFPEGEDPDSFARSHSAQETADFLEQAEEDFIKFKIALMAGETAKDPLARARLIREVIQSIAVVPDAITRSVYVEECSTRLEVEEGLLSREVAKIRKKRMLSGYRFPRADQPPVSSPPLPDAETDGAFPVKTGMQVSAETPPEGEAAFFEVSERDLLYYLIKFGQTYLSGSQNDFPPVRVADYIDNELKADKLELQVPLYRQIYNLYFSVNEPDDECYQRFFINYENPEISRFVLNLLMESQPLTIKQYRDSIDPEEMHLSDWVNKALLVYKSKVTNRACEVLREQIKDAQTADDTVLMQQLIEQLGILLRVKNTFTKELNRLL